MVRHRPSPVWRRLKNLLIAAGFISVVWTGVAAAQEAPASSAPPGRFAIGVGTGFHAGTADGTVFGLFADGRYALDEHLAVGPLLQLGVSSDLFLAGLSGQFTYTMRPPALPHVIPYLQGGLGLAVIDADHPRHDDDVGFLIPFGGGVDVELAKNLLLGTAVLLNYTSADVRGQPPIFMSWLVGFRFRMPG
jgi:hypothetical protein